ncbi:unnamed protein product [Aphanomyces euteiches]
MALQHKKQCRNTDELMSAVKDAFNELSPVTLNKTFMTLQRVMKMVIAIPRSKCHINEEDELTLRLLDIRLEEEDRLGELCELFQTCDV